MPRHKKWTLRSALFEIEALIPKSDRTPEAERERDLISVAACALWDEDIKKFTRAVRRMRYRDQVFALI